MGLWVVAELRKCVYRFARTISDILEPPEAAVDQLKFEPARSTAVRIALDAGWIQGLDDGRPHSPYELVIPGQSEELLGTSSWSNGPSAPILLTTLSPYFQSIDRLKACHRSVKAVVYGKQKNKIFAGHRSASWVITLVSFRSETTSTPIDCNKSKCRFDNMAPVFVHLPSYFASKGFHEPTNQETGPFAEVFDCTYWQRVNRSLKLKDDFDTYMAAHKKGGSSVVDLLPVNALTEGYNKTLSSALFVDIGGGVGHQSRELISRYPYLQGEIIVQDLQVSKELELVGVRGMEYNFFTPQPVKSKFLRALGNEFWF